MRQSTFIGKMVDDPQLRQTGNGTDVLNFEIMTTDQKGPTTEFHVFKLVVFGDAARRVARQAKKGSEILAICKPESRSYVKEGRVRKSEDHNCSWIRVSMGEE